MSEEKEFCKMEFKDIEGEKTHTQFWFKCEKESLKSEVDRLRAALDKYGRHLGECGMNNSWPMGACSCGFKQSLSPSAQEK